jgi:hypothetical protein
MQNELNNKIELPEITVFLNHVMGNLQDIAGLISDENEEQIKNLYNEIKNLENYVNAIKAYRTIKMDGFDL